MPTHRLRPIRLVALAAALALAATACGGGGGSAKGSAAKQGSTTAPDNAKPVAGGTLIFGQESDVATLDPSKALAQPADINIALAVYDPLMTFDDQGRLVPFLAESLDSSADLKTYTVKLHAGVVFQDGTPLNADAVIAHFKRQKDPATNCTCAPDVAHILAVDKVDDLTVKFTLDAPQVAFGGLLANPNGYIESPAAVAKYGKDYSQHPVGTGPFSLTEFIAGDHVTVVKNPRYWRKDKDGNALPYLDKVVFRPIPDTKARLAALQAGDIDMMQSADPSTIKSAEGAGLKVQKVSGSSSTVILLNNKRAPTDDERVREALARAVDKKALIDAVWAGTRQPSDTAFATSSPYYLKGTGNPSYDPTKAQALLKAYGKPVDVSLECIPTPEADQVLALVKQMWEAVGVKVTLKSTEQGQFVNKIFGTKDYQTACFRSAQFTDPDDGLYANTHSGGATNVLNYANPAVDKALDAGRATADPAARKAAYDTLQQEASKDVPVIYLAYDLFTNISKPSVHGLPVAEANYLGSIKVAGIWVTK